mmetsp:Transcript_47323/g.112104  ORF Transcript_47323/g.112104 Transcript_47323/m.112104 type:complete len:347 (-) Transcript_47323:1303-2343(-)
MSSSASKEKRVTYVPDAATVQLAVDAQRSKLLDSGMSRFSFFLGTVNFGVGFFIMGRAPEHYWIFHTIQACFLAVGRFVRGFKLKNLLCLLDFCWIANAVVLAYCVTLLVDTLTPSSPYIPHNIQVEAFYMFFALAAGPLGWSVWFTGNALVFHSIDQTASMFIHSSPMITAWCIRWHGARFFESYPSLLPLKDIIDTKSHVQSLYVHPAIFYFLWWVPFSLWMLFHGRHIRKPKWSQHTTWSLLCESSKVDKILQKTFGIKSDFMTVLIYLLTHAVLSNLVMALTIFLFQNYYAHTAHTILMLLCAVLNGAASYNYFLVESYARAVKKAIVEKQAQSEPKQEKQT